MWNVTANIEHDFAMLGVDYVDLMLVHWPCMYTRTHTHTYARTHAHAHTHVYQQHHHMLPCLVAHAVFNFEQMQLHIDTC